MMRWFSWGSISSCDRPKSLRQALPAPLPDADNRSVWHASSDMTIIIECNRRCRKNPHSLNGQVCQVLENVKPFTGTCIVLWRLHINPQTTPPEVAYKENQTGRSELFASSEWTSGYVHVREYLRIIRNARFGFLCMQLPWLENWKSKVWRKFIFKKYRMSAKLIFEDWSH